MQRSAMRYARNENPWSSPKAAHRNVRRHGRLRCQLLICSLGEVIDVSASGLRVSRRGKPPVKTGDVFDLALDGVNGPFVVEVRVVWVRKTGLRSRELGLEFAKLSPEARRQLNMIARACAQNDAVSDQIGDFPSLTPPN